MLERVAASSKDMPRAYRAMPENGGNTDHPPLAAYADRDRRVQPVPVQALGGGPDGVDVRGLHAPGAGRLFGVGDAGHLGEVIRDEAAAMPQEPRTQMGTAHGPMLPHPPSILGA